MNSFPKFMLFTALLCATVLALMWMKNDKELKLERMRIHAEAWKTYVPRATEKPSLLIRPDFENL